MIILKAQFDLGTIYYLQLLKVSSEIANYLGRPISLYLGNQGIADGLEVPTGSIFEESHNYVLDSNENTERQQLSSVGLNRAPNMKDHESSKRRATTQSKGYPIEFGKEHLITIMDSNDPSSLQDNSNANMQVCNEAESSMYIRCTRSKTKAKQGCISNCRDKRT